MKIQYYPIDLAYALGIGEITEMHIETLEGGVQVLRIECEKAKAEHYETVKVTKRASTTQKAPKTRKTRECDYPQEPRTRKPESPVTMGDKMMEFGKKWMSNKEKPNFMRDAGF